MPRNSFYDGNAGDTIAIDNSAAAASASETAAAASEAAAAISETNAAASYDSFDDRYLGVKSSGPTLDNDGDALVDGALYFDTTTNTMMVYDLGGTTWNRTTPTTSDQTKINTVSGIAANVTTVAGISANVTTVAGISSDVTTVAGKATEIGRLGTADAVADMAILGTTDIVADMAILGTADVVSDLNTLGTADVVSDLNTLGTADVVTDMNLLATSGNVTNMATLGASGVVSNISTVAGVAANVTTVAGISANVSTVAGISSDVTAVAGDATDIGTVAGKATEIGRLGTAAAVADMAILGTTDIVADMAILGTADVVSDMNILGTAAIVADMAILGTTDVVADMNTLGTTAVVADMNTLGTADVVSDLNTLGTADVVSDMNTLGTSGNVTNMNTLAGISANITTVAGISANVTTVAGVSTNVTTVASSIADVNRYADEYTIAATAPGSPSEGDLWYDSTSNVLKVHNGTSFVAVTSATAGITDVVDDTTPALGGMLDVNGNAIGDGTLELLKFSETASAVNELTIANAATGGGPTLSSTGSDTNVDINITPKGTGSVVIDGLKYPQADGAANQILKTDGSGQLSWTSDIDTGITDVVDDTTPQLGGSLDVNSKSIVSTSDGDIAITPNGTGDVVIDGLKYPQADGVSGQVLVTDGSAQLSFSTLTGASLEAGETFNNPNNISSSVTTTLEAIRNYMLIGDITVSGAATWTVDGTGELKIFTF